MIAAHSEAQSGEPMKALWGEPNSSVLNLKEYCDKMIANRETYTTKRNNPNGSWKDFIEVMKALWDDPNSVFNSKEYRDKMIMIVNLEAYDKNKQSKRFLERLQSTYEKPQGEKQFLKVWKYLETPV